MRWKLILALAAAMSIAILVGLWLAVQLYHAPMIWTYVALLLFIGIWAVPWRRRGRNKGRT